MNTLKLKAPCKINLSLDITSKRHDGYHTLESVFQTVSLFDEITLEKAQNGIKLDCKGADFDTQSNTCYKAATLFFKESAIDGGVKISLAKNIPSQAGLGGGSSDAASVLKGLNLLYNAKISDERLCEMGAQIGADVPFFIKGGTAYVSGIGEIIKPIKHIDGVSIVIAKGKSGISTVQAYKKFDKLNCALHTDTGKIVDYIEKSDIFAAAKLCVNSLECCAELEDIGDIKSVLEENGAFFSLMSGSGSAVFGLFSSRKNAETAALLCDKRFGFAAVCEPFDNSGTIYTI